MFLIYAVGKDRWPALRREVDPDLERFPVKLFLDDLEALREVHRMTDVILARQDGETAASPS